MIDKEHIGYEKFQRLWQGKRVSGEYGRLTNVYRKLRFLLQSQKYTNSTLLMKMMMQEVLDLIDRQYPGLVFRLKTESVADFIRNGSECDFEFLAFELFKMEEYCCG